MVIVIFRSIAAFSTLFAMAIGTNVAGAPLAHPASEYIGDSGRRPRIGRREGLKSLTSRQDEWQS
jgi:hypothetical protein